MTEKSTARSFLVKMSIFIAGLIVIDQATGRLASYGERDDLVIFMKGKKEFDRSHDYDAWVVGDSVAADDIVPWTMRQVTGLETFNWGIYGSSPVEWRHIARDLLDTSEAPDLAIIVVNHIMFDRPARANSYTLELLSGCDARIRLIADSADHQDLGALFLSGRKKMLVRAALLRLIMRRDPGSRNIIGVDNGYLISTDQAQGDPAPIVLSGIYNDRVWQDQAFHFNAMLDELEAHGVTTVLVVAPVHPMEADALKESDRYARLKQFVERTGRPVFNAVERYDELQFVGNDFKDVIHMNNSGATKLTYAVADWLSSLEE